MEREFFEADPAEANKKACNTKCRRKNESLIPLMLVKKVNADDVIILLLDKASLLLGIGGNTAAGGRKGADDECVLHELRNPFFNEANYSRAPFYKAQSMSASC